MSKPSELPEWASGGSALITDPTSGKKAIGFVPAERPPAQYLNWYMNLVYLWVVYLGSSSPVLPFSITSIDMISTSGGSGVTAAAHGTAGCTVTIGAQAYFRMPAIRSTDTLTQVNVTGITTPATATCRIYMYNPTSTNVLTAVSASTSLSGNTSVAITTPVVTGNNVFVLRVDATTASIVLYGGVATYTIG